MLKKLSFIAGRATRPLRNTLQQPSRSFSEYANIIVEVCFATHHKVNEQYTKSEILCVEN